MAAEPTDADTAPGPGCGLEFGRAPISAKGRSESLQSAVPVCVLRALGVTNVGDALHWRYQNGRVVATPTDTDGGVDLDTTHVYEVGSGHGVQASVTASSLRELRADGGDTVRFYTDDGQNIYLEVVEADDGD